MLQDGLMQPPGVHRLDGAHLDRQRLFAEHIDDGQGPELRAMGKLVRHKVHPPCLIGCGGFDPDLPAYYNLAAFVEHQAQLQLLLLV